MATDVRIGPDVDLLATSERLPFRLGSVRTVFAVDRLHHIPDVEALFQEIQRRSVFPAEVSSVTSRIGSLAPCTAICSIQRTSDPKVESWAFESDDPLTAANQALPYLLLRRDRERFESLFPDLEIIEVSPLNGPSYLLSGGISSPKRVVSARLATARRTVALVALAALHVLVVFRRRG